MKHKKARDKKKETSERGCDYQRRRCLQTTTAAAAERIKEMVEGDTYTQRARRVKVADRQAERELGGEAHDKSRVIINDEKGTINTLKETVKARESIERRCWRVLLLRTKPQPLPSPFSHALSEVGEQHKKGEEERQRGGGNIYIYTPVCV